MELPERVVDRLMVQWMQPKTKIKKLVTTLGDGLHYASHDGISPLQIGESYSQREINMDSRNYPSIDVRPPRTVYATAGTTNLFSLGERNNETLMGVDGKEWKYWNTATTAWVTLTTGLTSSTARAEIQDFVTGTTRRTILMNSTNAIRQYNGTTSIITVSDTNQPYTNLFTVHKGRVYAATGSMIKYSALNKSTDWTAANDAGSITVTQARGSITAICEFNDKVIVWTEYSMHELYGTGPINYELIDIEGNIGCVAPRSVVKCGARLYWMGYDGIYEYDGGSAPTKISDPWVEYHVRLINKTITLAARRSKIVAGTVGDYVYLALSYNMVLKYNTRLRKWNYEAGNFNDMVTVNENLFAVDTLGTIWNMRDMFGTEGFDTYSTGNTPISWYIATKAFNHDTIAGKKTLTDLYMNAHQSTSSTSFTVHGTTKLFPVVGSMDALYESTYGSTGGPRSYFDKTRIQVPVNTLQNSDWYVLYLSGTGRVSIHGIEHHLRVKE